MLPQDYYGIPTCTQVSTCTIRRRVLAVAVGLDDHACIVLQYIGGGTNGAKGLKPPPKNSTYIMNNNKVIAFLTRIKLN